MKKILILTLFLNITLFSQQKQICFTMDDLPVITYGINDTAYQNMIVDNFISSFVEYNIPAIGFVNETKLYDDNGLIQYFSSKLILPVRIYLLICIWIYLSQSLFQRPVKCCDPFPSQSEIQ